MSSPYTYMGQPEITAVPAFYGKEVHVHFDQTTLPPTFATTDDVHLRYTAMSRHYDTFQPIISLDITTLSNQLSLTPSNNPTPRFQVVAYLLHHNDAPSYGQRGCQRLAKLCGCQSSFLKTYPVAVPVYSLSLIHI